MRPVSFHVYITVPPLRRLLLRDENTRNFQRRLRKSNTGYVDGMIVAEISLHVYTIYSQASLRYRELNDALETVQEKLRDARVGFTVCIHVYIHTCICELVHQNYMYIMISKL